jgi:hypothetical protein
MKGLDRVRDLEPAADGEDWAVPERGGCLIGGSRHGDDSEPQNP